MNTFSCVIYSEYDGEFLIASLNCKILKTQYERTYLCYIPKNKPFKRILNKEIVKELL